MAGPVPAGTMIHKDRTHTVASPAVDPRAQTNTLQTTVLSVAASGWRRVVVVKNNNNNKKKGQTLFSLVNSGEEKQAKELRKGGVGMDECRGTRGDIDTLAL